VAGAEVTYTRTLTRLQGLIILNGVDAVAEVFTNWSSDADFDYNYTYLSADGAVNGRAATSHVVFGEKVSTVYSTGIPTPTTGGGVPHAVIDINAV
jgi:hypothetical protein